MLLDVEVTVRVLLYSDDLEYLPVLVSLPAGQSVFEYLVGAWKRLNATRTALGKKVTLTSILDVKQIS